MQSLSVTVGATGVTASILNSADGQTYSLPF